MKECGSPELEARREAYRGTSDPGYINYTLGKLEIRHASRAFPLPAYCAHSRQGCREGQAICELRQGCALASLRMGT
jgi:hypothetical protein